MNSLFVAVLFLHPCLGICNGVLVLGLSSMNNGEFDKMARGVCAGKIGECAAEVVAVAEEEEELQMDSESNRRVLLMQKSYISYETLQRDLVPCTTPGASYYDCKPAGESNVHRRGCEIITRCARSISDIKS
ncbi:hypothetical protein U1Q18_025105 [Sarracenia purpurea var. burkii]